MLDRTDEAGRTERIINHQRNAVPVGNGSYFLQRDEVGIGVAHGLEEDGTGGRGDGGLEVLHVGRVDECGRYAVRGQGMRQQVIAAAIDGAGRYDVVALTGKVEQGIGDGCGSRGHGYGCHTAFEGCHALFEYVLCGVAQTGVDFARLLQTEAGGCIGRVLEDEGSRLVDGYGAGTGGCIRLFLAGM